MWWNTRALIVDQEKSQNWWWTWLLTIWLGPKNMWISNYYIGFTTSIFVTSVILVIVGFYRCYVSQKRAALEKRGQLTRAPLMMALLMPVVIHPPNTVTGYAKSPDNPQPIDGLSSTRPGSYSNLTSTSEVVHWPLNPLQYLNPMQPHLLTSLSLQPLVMTLFWRKRN